MGIKIVSGGQTGVDRGALDAALAAGAECGGWCPARRRAEDGRIPAEYPVRELRGAGYADRTRRNVEDSDGTLVIRFERPGRGTELTARHASGSGKPLLVIDAEATPADQAADRVTAFVARHGIRVLNVAGPRASHAPGARAYARQLIAAVLRAAD